MVTRRDFLTAAGVAPTAILARGKAESWPAAPADPRVPIDHLRRLMADAGFSDAGRVMFSDHVEMLTVEPLGFRLVAVHASDPYDTRSPQVGGIVESAAFRYKFEARELAQPASYNNDLAVVCERLDGQGERDIPLVSGSLFGPTWHEVFSQIVHTEARFSLSRKF